MLARAPDAALREDVRLLGELLGHVLKAHEGSELYDLVEDVRALAKRARLGHRADRDALIARLAAMPSSSALPLARAFAHFLALANVAEQHHRARSYAAGEPALAACVRRARDGGMDAAAITALLETLHIELVLTAHPTQVVRRTVRMQHRAIHDTLSRRDRATGKAREPLHTELARHVALLWHTDEVRRRKPTVSDEVRGALVLFEQVLWDAVPRHLRAVDDVLMTEIGRRLPDEAVPVRFGSWVGGDRDGNPLVTSTVTREATLRARWTAARLWQRTLDALRDELAVVAANDEVRREANGEREPYRALLSAWIDRLARTERWCEAAINAVVGETREPRPPDDLALDASELIRTLDALDASLRAVNLAVVADGPLLDARRRARCFGLTLAPLDVRQDAGVHAGVLDAITTALGLGSYLAWDERERMTFLRRELASPRPLLPRDPIDHEPTRELMATLDVVRRGGPGAFGAYVISMAKAPSDVLAVMLLQREARIARPLRVVPLFETLEDLEHARDATEALLQEEAFLAHAGSHVEIMVGYSDSTKDAGRVGSAWAIHRALEGVTAVVRARGKEPVFFHGRGGTVGRGGAPIRDSILSLPAGTVRDRVRVTVQGETIDSTLGLESTAVLSLDLYLASVFEAASCGVSPAEPAWRSEMDRLAADATTAYRSVVHGDPRFVPYFRAVTPERELALIHAGSRPARRQQKDDIASLRAIPWVFAWNQVRFMIPASLGLGEALEPALSDPVRSKRITTMARQWPFFRSLTGLISMALAKCDPGVLSLYEQQLVSEDLRPVGEDLRKRFAGTMSTLLRVVDQSELLANEPFLQSSIALRNPYIDPLNILQAELLRRMRGGDEDPTVREALLVTINGVAAALRNTG